MTQRKPHSESGRAAGTTEKINSMYRQGDAANGARKSSYSDNVPETRKSPYSGNGSVTNKSSHSDTVSESRRYSQNDTASENRKSSHSKNYKKKKKKQLIRLVKLAAIAVAAVAVIVLAVVLITANSGKNTPSGSSSETAQTDAGQVTTAANADDTTAEAESPSETEAPTEPYVVSEATIGATGDLLTHNSVLNSAFDGVDSYDFTDNFAAVAPYWSAMDYMVVNLEVPCSGSTGVKGSQYPTFDAPDSLVSALANAGVDMFLTATNHTYDCRDDGLIHTQELINSLGLDHTGTRLSTPENYYLIKEINGIKFGMVCYTYDTREEVTDDLSLNTIPLNEESWDLVNSFCYSDAGLEELYSAVSSDIAAMDSAGCDVKVFFMHWGTEYMDAPSDFIRGIAAKLSDLGADLIIGGHPHVIQPFEVITGSGGNTTYCLYSTGNCLSSQRKEIMNEDGYRGYTEDGITISFTYEKYSDGSVCLKDLNVLPTWVDADGYKVIPLDDSLTSDQWATWYTAEAVASYDRTIGRVGEEYSALKTQLAQGLGN